MEIEKLRQIGKRKKCTIISRYSSYVVTFPEYHNRSYSVYTRYEKKAKLVAFLRFRSAIRSSISGRRKQYENDLNSIYLILDERDRTRQDYNPLETVLCPQCSNEVYKWINDKTLCPKCGGRLLFEGGADYD